MSNSHCHTHTLTPSPRRSCQWEWPVLCHYLVWVVLQRGRWRPLQRRGRGTPVRPKHARVPSVPAPQPGEGRGLSSRHRLGGQPPCMPQDLARVASASPLCSSSLPPTLTASPPPPISPSLHGQAHSASSPLPSGSTRVHCPWGLTHTESSGFLTYGRTLPPPPHSQDFRQALATVVKVATQPRSAHANTTASSHPTGCAFYPGPQGERGCARGREAWARLPACRSNSSSSSTKRLCLGSRQPHVVSRGSGSSTRRQTPTTLRASSPCGSCIPRLTLDGL